MRGEKNMKPMLLNKNILFEEDQKRLTDSFVRGFEEDGVYESKVAWIVAKGILPVGVNEDDPRVQNIMWRCRLGLFRTTSALRHADRGV